MVKWCVCIYYTWFRTKYDIYMIYAYGREYSYKNFLIYYILYINICTNYFIDINFNTHYYL